MDKGVRPASNAKFAELNALWNKDEYGPKGTAKANAAFRKAVVGYLADAFVISWASACTAYNHSFIEFRKANPTLVVGLGRPEDKKGSRKKKVTIVAEAVAAILGNEEQQETMAAQVGEALEGLCSAVALTETVPDSVPSAEVVEETAQAVYEVRKVKDNTVVASNLSIEAANELVAKAATAKKAKLFVA